MGTTQAPVNNSKGCGGIMRVAPVGLFLDQDKAFDAACEIAAITHGHPTGYLAAGCLAQIICCIISGDELVTAVEKTVAILKTKDHNRDCRNAISSACSAWKEKPASFETVESLGQGWVAEEALAIGIYCSLAAGNSFEKGIGLAVNHGGDSDSTGSITGNILGALFGADSIPSKYTGPLELIDAITEMSEDLFAQR
jgi:ADP-ribosylglycohydrolase